MLAAIQRRFPAHVRWNRPEGGFFVWVALPSPLDGEDLLQRAVQHDVAFVAGRPFFADGTGRETIRLSFSQAPDDVIDAAIAELGSIIGARLQAWAL
jgi:DNA-binding transcriptional MocR family regulator